MYLSSLKLPVLETKSDGSLDLNSSGKQTLLKPYKSQIFLAIVWPGLFTLLKSLSYKISIVLNLDFSWELVITLNIGFLCVT